MIPAIDPGIGRTEERPTSQASQTGSQGFSQALKKAAGHSRPENNRPLAEKRAAGDPRQRDRFADASAEADRAANARDAGAARQSADARDTAAQDAAAQGQARGQTELEQAAQRTDQPHLEPSNIPPDVLADAAADPALAALALQAVNEGESFGVAADASPISAQIGAAAYRLGPHSEAELARAEAQGVILPGSTKAQLLGKGVQDVKSATMVETDPAELALDPKQTKADQSDVVIASKVAEAEANDRVSYREQIALQTAQARNEILSRISGAGGGDAGEGLQSGSGDALRQQLQLQGLLARHARAQTVDATAADSPPTLASGVVGSAKSVDLTQVFETPRDDAVQYRVLERVANEARWLIGNDRQEVTLRLSPEHLGSLSMKVVQKDGIFRVDLMVDNLAAKHLLESNLQDLRNRLAGDNPGGEFMFNVDVRQGNEQPSLYSRAGRQAAPGAIGRPDGLDDAPAAGLAGRVLGHSGLSIYV